uniref:Uncharacterized protein n=1 Tax=Arundo donax TaxID=35708 RepID=A0A0A8YQ97_ARUDO
MAESKREATCMQAFINSSLLSMDRSS